MIGAALNWYPIAEVAEASASRIVNGTLEGLVIAAAAALLLRTLRGQNSSTRFAICFVSLISIALVSFSGVISSHAAMSSSPTWEVTVPSSWPIYFFAVWSVISSIALARLALSMRRLRQIRRQSLPLSPSSLDPLLQHTMQQFAHGRQVALCVSDDVETPTALGFMSPAVVLPRWAVQELTSTELNVVLLHELAHLHRWDDWTNLAQKILRAVFFFHPAVWWLESRLTIEREMACDDAVLTQTANPRDYAQCLVSLAEKSLARRSVALAQAIIGRVQQTSRRVRQILDLKRSPSTKVWNPIFSSVAAVLMATVALVSRTPQFFAFQETPAPTLASSAPELPLLQRAVSYVEPSNRAKPSVRPLKLHPAAGPYVKIVTASAAKPRSAFTSSAPRISATGKSVIEASFVPRQVRGRVSSSADLQSSAEVRSSTLLFVMGTQQYNESGSPVLTVAVWQITMWVPNAPAAITTTRENRLPAKKI